MAKVRITTSISEANHEWLQRNAGGPKMIGELIDAAIEAMRTGRPVAERLELAVERSERLAETLQGIVEALRHGA